MLPDLLVHAGAEHPALVWIIVPAILSFIAGLTAGARGLHRRVLAKDLTADS